MPRGTLTSRLVAELRLSYLKALALHESLDLGPVTPPWQSPEDYGVDRATVYKAVTGRSFKKVPMSVQHLEVWLKRDDLDTWLRNNPE